MHVYAYLYKYIYQNVYKNNTEILLTNFLISKHFINLLKKCTSFILTESSLLLNVPYKKIKRITYTSTDFSVKKKSKDSEDIIMKKKKEKLQISYKPYKINQ